MPVSFTLSIENFGPIRKGKLQIKPVTVLIGPNNTGKSYSMMLFYSLMRVLSKVSKELQIMFLEELAYLHYYPLRALKRKITSKELSEIKEIIKELQKEQVNNLAIKKAITDLIDLYSKEHLERFNKYVNSPELKESLLAEIERVFSTEVFNLTKDMKNIACINLNINGKYTELTCSIKIHPHRKDVKFQASIKLNKEQITNAVLKIVLDISRNKRINGTKLLIKVAKKILSSIYEIPALISSKNIYYLPASRAGILHSYRTVASAIVTSAPLAAIRGAEIPRISGVIADFLGNLLKMEPAGGRKIFIPVEEEIPLRVFKFATKKEELYNLIKEAGSILEKDILGGNIELERRTPILLPEPVYKFNNIKLSIANVSSMVAELTPLDLYIKYGLIKPGDILIIEEPESHLHPDKQIKLMEVLTYIAKKLGITIIITTHSDLILARLSNLISLSALRSEEAKDIGLDKKYSIKPSQVAVYSFLKEKDGVRIDKVKVSIEGIPDDVFRKIIKELYEETMSMYYRVQKIMKERR